MRADGFVRIYKIQVFDKDLQRWLPVNFGFFSRPPGFGFKDNCYKQTGEDGCFHRATAFDGLRLLRDKYPTFTFQLTMVELTQLTIVVKER